MVSVAHIGNLTFMGFQKLGFPFEPDSTIYLYRLYFFLPLIQVEHFPATDKSKNTHILVNCSDAC